MNNEYSKYVSDDIATEFAYQGAKIVGLKQNPGNSYILTLQTKKGVNVSVRISAGMRKLLIEFLSYSNLKPQGVARKAA